jgi:excinuclease ABC subunit C
MGSAPLRIECFDVSQIQGTDVVASMVVFEDGLPRKAEYRRFAVRGNPDGSGMDDLAAMSEVMRRRFARYRAQAGADAAGAPSDDRAFDADAPDDATAELPGIDPLTGRPRRFAYPPQLVVVDGGQPQVNAVAAVLSDLGITDVALCGLAKRLEEVWLPGEDFPVILPRTSEALYLLQRVRDEAHRFAITFHRQRRSKRMTASALDNIPGLGETRRKALLRHFGSLKRLGQATPEEIAEVHGIGRRTAEAVLAALNPPPDKPEADGEAADRPTTIPAGGAGRTKAGARRSRTGLPAPAPVKTSAVREAVAETAAGAPAAGDEAAGEPAASP